ncbi:MAG: hypothetical protein HIU83_01005 [Proteobacteria bacterium]|nr:hypothetical protein [Pseudomonadota bacterium]
MGGESTTSSQTASKPLTAAERQDLYRSSIGNILNTYTQSGLPYGGTGSMSNASNATFNPIATNSQAPGQMQTGYTPGAWGSLYDATGNSSTYDKGGKAYSPPLIPGLDPGKEFANGMEGIKAYFQAPDPTVNMPTGAADPGGINLPVYQTPQYQSGGAFQAGGYTQGLDYAKGKDMQALDNNLAKRGLWSSGLALQAANDTNAAYSGAYEKAGADQATAQNAYNQAGAQAANNFNVTNANNSYQAGWKPLEYLQGLWNNTGGQTSGSSSFGQSINVGV